MVQTTGRATTTSTTTEHERTLAAVTEERLVARYASDDDQAEAVRGAVAEAFGRLEGARIRAFLPILVERSVRHRLARPV